ncbi:hypothetical protein POM88_006811 [Heracleum sosnowskyi]|uniref:Uncharacterized protein n=1 Tax=Heracleum sosnowskyi TaxID=360622 RepID=A0AAD8N6V2_9APIA|nr:hypothetical protein POM88_006811 [Heracleum sosnowskyi]
MFIKQQILYEDEESSKDDVKRVSKTVTSKPTIKTVDVKGYGYAYVKNASRKLCNNCGSSHHLTNVCKKPTETKVNVTEVTGNLHRTPIMHRSMDVCNNTDCMPCKITAMSTCFNLPILSTDNCSYMNCGETSEPTVNSRKATPTKKKTKSYSKPKWVAKEVEQKISDCYIDVENDGNSGDTNSAGPNKDWVPYAT